MPADLKPSMYSPTDRQAWPNHTFLHPLSDHHNSPDIHGENANGTELANERLTVQIFALQASSFTTVTVVQI